MQRRVFVSAALEFLDVALASPVSTIPTDPAALQAALQQVQGGMQKSWPGLS